MLLLKRIRRNYWLIGRGWEADEGDLMVEMLRTI